MYHSKSFLQFIGLFLSAIAVIILNDACNNRDAGRPAVLVFSKSKGWQHGSIPAANSAIYKLGTENGFEVDTTKDAEIFTDDNLKKYHAVVFANTTRNVLNAKQQAAFERYIQAGGGFVGIHSAADTEYEWPWYGKLLGAYFQSHPSNPGVRKASISVSDTSHLSTIGLPATWERTDEWYNYKNIYSGIRVLASLDESSYEGGTNGNNHPIAWYHEFDGGRSFYTGGGHEISSYTEPLFLQHLLGGLRYAMGEGKLDYSKSYAVEIPEENRFVKTILVNDLDTPMELAVSDEGEIFFSEFRTANLMMYDNKTGKTKLVHRFDVATKGGTGLIGVTLDPKFSTNRFIYLYYSPPTDKEPVDFYLSRFKVNDDFSLDTTSEKILLKVPVQINSGAHHGGSLAWDKDGNLYLSTGDSSSPFPANGYAPMDERPGAEFFSLDAQRSSSNTNDLKGKVLRIHPEADGSYSIPAGNLFPPGTDSTLPEIYTMGCRNPYRIAVNPKTSVLYWGEIGPDAGRDSIQGPRGYDEFNQAKKAGNYGWPYFVGNNQAYAKWNFATNTAGPKYNPAAPENFSPNNTGLKKLPPATTAMIWYPYAASTEFPEMGIGGRSAMAGSFYNFNEDAKSATQFPSYYDGALFVFDWMRNWVMVLRFDKDENLLKSEPFMAGNGDFRRPIDLAFGKDGVMYMLEYGSVYGADNDDARLVKIEYNKGNRSPKANATIIDSAAVASLAARVFLTSENKNYIKLKEIAGPLPLRVKFTAQGSADPDDDDDISYEWNFENNAAAKEANPVYTFNKAGNYKVVLKVADQNGLTGTDTVLVKAGNAPPSVEIVTDANKSFYWPGETFNYTVKVNDLEDGDQAVKAGVFFNYNKNAGSLSNEEQLLAAKSDLNADNPHPGAALIASNDCKACHVVKGKSVGPAYISIAEKYKAEAGALAKLTSKVIAGGGGNWGKEHVMSAHPQLSPLDVNEMVKYILSLADEQVQLKTLPVKGKINLNLHKTEDPKGLYTLIATYTDQGANGISSLKESEVLSLRSAKVKTIDADAHPGFARYGNYVGAGSHKSHILLKNIDLTAIKKIDFEIGGGNKDGEIEVRTDSYAGPVIALASFSKKEIKDKPSVIPAELKGATNGRHDLYFVVKKKGESSENIVNVISINFEK